MNIIYEAFGSRKGEGAPQQARKPRAFLHIGPHKTGTSTLQTSAAAAGLALVDYNIVYPESIRSRSPNSKDNKSPNSSHKTQDSHLLLGCASATLSESPAARINPTEAAKLLEDEARGRDILLSAESFSFCGEESHLRLRDVVLRGFEVHVVAVHRDSGSWSVSRYHQTTKWKPVTDSFALYSMLAWQQWVAWNCEVLSPGCMDMLSRVYGRDHVHYISMEGTVAAGLTQLDTIVCGIAEACHGSSTVKVGNAETPGGESEELITVNKSFPDLWFEAAVLYNHVAAMMGCSHLLKVDQGGSVLEALGMKHEDELTWHKRQVSHPGRLLAWEPMVECVPKEALPVLYSQQELLRSMKSHGHMHNFDNHLNGTSHHVDNYCFLNHYRILSDTASRSLLLRLLQRDGCHFKAHT